MKQGMPGTTRNIIPIRKGRPTSHDADLPNMKI